MLSLEYQRGSEPNDFSNVVSETYTSNREKHRNDVYSSKSISPMCTLQLWAISRCMLVMCCGMFLIAHRESPKLGIPSAASVTTWLYMGEEPSARSNHLLKYPSRSIGHLCTAGLFHNGRHRCDTARHNKHPVDVSIRAGAPDWHHRRTDPTAALELLWTLQASYLSQACVHTSRGK